MPSHRAHTGLYLVALLVVGCLAGCADDALCPCDSPPVACLRMGVIRYHSDCPLAVRFIANPDCSGDDRTPYADLQIRWDFGADGTWDTDFGSMKAQWGAGPSSVSATMWRVRCEVKDGAGQTAETIDSLDLRPLLPRPPDIIVGKVIVELWRSGQEVDTVSVGVPFCIWATQRCWMDPTEDVYLIEYRLDGALIDHAWAHTTPAVGDCQYYGKCMLTVDHPGTYEIEATLDAANTFLETNETNNVARRSLVVVDAPPN